MGALADAYRAELERIPHARGTDEWAAAKLTVWRKFEEGALVRAFQREGDTRIIRRVQVKFAQEYYTLVESFYNGEVPEEDYRLRRIRTLRRYAERLVKLGLLTGVFDAAWVRGFARDSLQHERELLPVPDVFTGWTDANSETLCIPLRDFSKRFFRALHAEFGVGRLRETPEAYGGVELKQETASASAERIR
jgi:hypothetical protein